MQSSISHQVLNPLKLSPRQAALPDLLESPSSHSITKPRYRSLFEKIDLTSKKCEIIKKTVQNTSKKYSKSIENNLKNIEDLSNTYEKLDSSWKEKIQQFKETKSKRNKVFNKFKGLSHNEHSEKEPIRRMNLKNVLKAARETRISASEIYSSAVKLVLMKNKRKFGEIRLGNNKINEKRGKNSSNLQLKINSADEQKKNLSNRELKGENNLRLDKRKESRIFESAKKLPKLARQIKDFKYKSYD